MYRSDSSTKAQTKTSKPSKKTFLSKNSRSTSEVTYRCRVKSNVNGDDNVTCDCNIIEEPEPYSPEKDKRKHITFDVPTDNNSSNSIVSNIQKLMASKNRLAVRENGRSMPRWIDVTNGIMTYKFNVFNNDPASVDHGKLASILRAIQKDNDINMIEDYGRTSVFNLYKLEDMANPKLFQGDRLAIFIGKYKNGMFHYVNTPEPANTQSFPLGAGALKVYNITLPAGSNYDYIPYSVISSDDIPKFYGMPDNIYAVGPQTVSDPFHQVLSMALSHEVREILGNDMTMNWVMFDQYAPTVQNWKWSEFKDKMNPSNITNGKMRKDGIVELPSFLSKFPKGGIMFAVREVGDVVSTGSAGYLNSYSVDGWLMINYPLRTFWDAYNTDPNVKYDKLGLVQIPMEPYGGQHQLIFFVSMDDGKTRLLEVTNRGPVTYQMRGASPKNNFPLNYVTVKEIAYIAPGMDVKELIAAVENYDPANPDRT